MTVTDHSMHTSARQSRVVYVGRPQDTLADDALRQFAITAVPDVFHALGEVSSAPARQPVTAVLIDGRSINMNLREVSEAFANLDPSIRLILVQAAADRVASETMQQAGFDEVLTAPVDVEAARRAIANGHNAGDARPVGVTARADACEQRHEHDDDEIALNVSEIDAVSAMASAPQRPDRAAGRSIDAHRSPAGSTGDAADPPGDVDLIDAVMNRPGDLVGTALAAIAAHGGFSSPMLRREDNEAAEGAIVRGPASDGAPGTVFGRLSADGASTAALEPWAEWLGWWLSLDRKMRALRRWAYQDELTGAWNRRFYFSFVQQTINDARSKRLPVTVMLFDLDDFKVYNDDFGHEAGDEILCETVALLKSVIRQGDRVCRIGGDEFAVVFADLQGPREPGSTPPETVEQVARRFQDQVCKLKFPKLGPQAPATLSISAGIATFPWDGQDPSTLLRVADQRALESKQRGKNAITFGPGARCRHEDPFDGDAGDGSVPSGP